MLGKFSAIIEATCSKVDAEFLVVESETSLQGYTTATELGILLISNAMLYQWRKANSSGTLVYSLV